MIPRVEHNHSSPVNWSKASDIFLLGGSLRPEGEGRGWGGGGGKRGLPKAKLGEEFCFPVPPLVEDCSTREDCFKSERRNRANDDGQVRTGEGD